MDEQVKKLFDGLESIDKQVQYESYQKILAITENEVDWAYEVWDELLQNLISIDHHTRSRAAQFLSNLAISDPENRMFADFPALWKVTKDPKFVTARHCLQTIWKVGLAGEKQREMLVNHLSERFIHCVGEKNFTLIRYDIIQGLKYLYDEVKTEEIKRKASELIELEKDNKYQKKYAKVWKHA